MKKLFIIAIFAVVGWTSYYDMTKGTLAFIGSNETKASEPAIPFQTVHVQPGDTVLSLYEKLNPSSTYDIDQVLRDFKKLNHGVDPNHIQIGKTYRIPLDESHP